jgi:hypothetical protein
MPRRETTLRQGLTRFDDIRAATNRIIHAQYGVVFAPL